MSELPTSGSLALQSDFKVNEDSGLRVIPRDVFGRVTTLLERGAEEGVFPGAVLIVGKNGEEVYRKAAGVRSLPLEKDQPVPKMHPDMVFDIASLTQQVATTTLMMKLVAARSVGLDERVSRYLQWFSVGGKGPVTIRQLLNHTSGLPAWHPFFEELQRQDSGARVGILKSRGAREYVYNALNRFQIRGKPGQKEVYSDLGFMVLGALIEALTGVELQKAAKQHVYCPFQLESTNFIDLAMIKSRGIKLVTDRVVPTEECSWRKRVLCGEVHDDNAWAMGGVAGHAGLFSSAPDLLQFGQEILRAYFGQEGCVDPATVRLFLDDGFGDRDRVFSLGWQRAQHSAGMDECNFSERAVGHNSFTGCSLWIDPESASVIVFASNRVHPTRSNKKINEFRKELFATINQAIC